MQESLIKQDLTFALAARFIEAMLRAGKDPETVVAKGFAIAKTFVEMAIELRHLEIIHMPEDAPAKPN